MPSDDLLRVHYRLRLARGESARAKAVSIAREQTIELAPRIVPAAVERRAVGRVVRVETDGAARARAAIDYPWREVVSDLPQLLNLLFGNISMQRGIRLEAIDWPRSLLAEFPGPRHGVAGVREKLGAFGRPLLAAVLKPLGLSSRELALHAGECALAGVDILKDDHSLADQPAAPFRERVFAIAERVRHAAQSRGTRTLYLPNLSGPVDRILERVEDLREAGLEGGFVAPMSLGLDVLRSLASTSGLVLLAHPSFAGSFFAPGHGLAPELVFGDLFRLAGADIVDFPVAGGRFAFSARDVRAVTSHLSDPLGDYPASFPMVAGGLDRDKLRRILPRHPVDTVFLVGGGIYRGGRTRANAEALVELVRGEQPSLES